jgi:hypothetical protein
VQFIVRFGVMEETKMRPNVIKNPNSRVQRFIYIGCAASVLAAACSSSGLAADVGNKETQKQAVLWQDPTDISTRDLFYGSGGKEHEPHGPFTFEKEDMNGTNPKFDVKDADGKKWKVKLGLEARPENAASRLVWAAGYFTTDDYFLDEIQVANMPAHLHRGQKLEGPGGTFHHVRLKREPEGAKKDGTWSWRDDPFTNTREWNGLRTLMAVINNWDLKDENNAVYKDKEKEEKIYMVSDLGASFGFPALEEPLSKSKDNFHAYSHARFIRRERADSVDFQSPGRAGLIFLFDPPEYFQRLHLEWLHKNVPRADAKWLGQILGRLSHDQLRDAFRASGYSPDEAEAFAKVLESRITTLSDL